MKKTVELSAGQQRYLLMIRVQVNALIEARGGKCDLASAARFLSFEPAHVELAFSLGD